MKRTNLIVFIFFIFLSSGIIASEGLKEKNFLCSDLLWGFEFISSEKVLVVDTDINSNSKVREYYYETDLKLSYVNIYLTPNKKIRDLIYSIHLPTLRVDIWTMTSGGITSREILPKGFCKITNITNILQFIERLKNL